MRSGGVTGIHPTKEGGIYISANTPHFWAALCERTGLNELLADPRFATLRQRAQHVDELLPKVRSALMRHTALEWEAIFGEHVPNAAVRPLEDMFDFEQVLAEEMIATIHHPTIGNYHCLQHPIKFGATPGPTPFSAPVFGEHSVSILEGLGFPPEEISRLQKGGVITSSGTDDESLS